MKLIQGNKKELSPKQRDELFKALKARFEKNLGRHQGLVWAKVQARLEAYLPDVIGLTYTIQASTDLVNWISLHTNVSPFTFADTNHFPQRFYRSIYFP